MNEKIALKKAIELAGGQTALAEKLNEIRNDGSTLKQGHIWSWLNRVGKAPAEYVADIVTIVGGQVTPHQLRPDVFRKSEMIDSRTSVEHR